MVNWSKMIWHSSIRSTSSMESSANSGQRTRPQNRPTRTWSVCRCRSGWSLTSYRCLIAQELVTQHGGRSRSNRWQTITKNKGGSNSSLSTRGSLWELWEKHRRNKGTWSVSSHSLTMLTIHKSEIVDRFSSILCLSSMRYQAHQRFQESQG